MPNLERFKDSKLIHRFRRRQPQYPWPIINRDAFLPMDAAQAPPDPDMLPIPTAAEIVNHLLGHHHEIDIKAISTDPVEGLDLNLLAHLAAHSGQIPKEEPARINQQGGKPLHGHHRPHTAQDIIPRFWQEPTRRRQVS